MSKLNQLTPNSTLGDLPLHDFQVSPKTRCKVLANVFAKRPELPGAIVADRTRLIGMISRRRFNDWMSSHLGIDVFLESQIETFFPMITMKVKLLQLPDTETVDLAVKQALCRAAEDIYEPIVIVYKDLSLPDFRVYFLLDFVTLILAQNQIFTRRNKQVETHKKQSNSQLELARDSQKIEKYNQIVKGQKAAIAERNQLLETQRIELANKSQEIAQLNQRFERVGQLISQKATKAFRATFSGVNVIGRQTNQIVDIGRLLSEELERIQDTSQLIKRVSQQVRHLAVKAAIVANHAGTELHSFSQITTEIGTLVSQTFEAGRQMDHSADRFMQKIQEFTESAHRGMKVTKSLIQEIEQAEMVLAELETLVQQHGSNLSRKKELETITAAANSQEYLEEIGKGSRALVEKLALAEATLSDLQEMTRYKDSAPIVRKIRRALHKYKTY
jgi:hypothetical protein